jgi:CheY-like chemotaxis protein
MSWIVLVDDDADVQLAFTWFVKKYFPEYQVLYLASSDNFLEKVEKLDLIPALFVFDLYLEGPLDGRSLFLLVQQMDSYKDVPVLGISASIRQIEIEDLKNLGFHIVASKPFDNERLHAVLLDTFKSMKRTWVFIPSPNISNVS